MLTFNVKVEDTVTLKTDALRKAYERGAHLNKVAVANESDISKAVDGITMGENRRRPG